MEGPPREVIHGRHAEPALRRAGRGARAPTGASSWSAAGAARRTSTATADPARPDGVQLAGLSLNPVADCEAMTDFPFMVNALGRGRSSP